MLTEVVVRQPRIIVGAEQGGLIALCLSRPLLVEAACRQRLLTASEMLRIRSAWSNVVSLLSYSPLILPQAADSEVFLAAVPEFGFTQPVGLHVAITIRTTLSVLVLGLSML